MTRSTHSLDDPQSSRNADGWGTRLAANSLLVLTLLVLSGPAASAKDKAATARRSFQTAEKAYALGNYKTAIQHYEAAYRAMPEPAFLFNIAQAQRMQYGVDQQVWRLQKALALYKSYLREAKQPPNRVVVEKIIDDLRSVLDEVQRRAHKQSAPGEVVLRGEVGAEVSLDGQPIGTLPLVTKVKPGAHVIRVEKAGYEAWETSITVAAGSQLEVPVSLKQRPQQTASTPFYRTWWFWTITGVAIAAGAGTGIYFATRSTGDGIPTIDLR